ncbi:hypothetical protein OXX79_007714 [Metschnikowia pulcherrima]
MSEISKGHPHDVMDLSVDEIFTRHSVHSVKGLQEKYHANVRMAKADLHSLVGKKYRDLIQIAEDIDQMNSMSKTIDHKLADLSYHTPSHVPFGTSKNSHFDSKSRHAKAKAARVASQFTILHDVVNNQVLPFDLKLQESGHIHSRHLVHMAKVFYTLESIFGSDQKTAQYTRGLLAQYKQRFISYLENSIASLFPRSSPSKALSASVIIRSHSRELESDIIDYLDEPLEIDQEMVSEDEEMGETPHSQRHFAGSSSPMSNYIVAYIFLGRQVSNFDSLYQVAEKIIDLRFEYLRGLLEDSLDTDMRIPSKLNMSFIIAYAESTFFCIKKYFLAAGTSDILENLTRASTWRASELIGFHDWFDSDIIEFGTSAFRHLEPDFLSSPKHQDPAFAEYISRVFTRILNNETAIDPPQQAREALGLLHNFVAACRKAEVNASLSGSKCLTVEVFASCNLVQKVLELVASHIEKLLMSQETCLVGDISARITTDLTKISSVKAPGVNPFEPETIDLIDEKFEGYFDRLMSLSLMTPEVESNVALGSGQRLKQWFDIQEALLSTISGSEPGPLSQIIHVLKKTYANSNPFKSWGSFGVESCTSIFRNIVRERKQSMKSIIGNLLKAIESSVKSYDFRTDTAQLHFILSLVHLLRVNSSLYSDQTFDSNLSGVFLETLRKLFDVLEVRLTSLRSNSSIFSLVLNYEDVMIPLRPNLVVTSLMDQASTLFLSSTFYNSGELFEILQCKQNRSLFIQTKNTWISQSLIWNDLLEGSVPELPVESEDSLDSAKCLMDRTEEHADGNEELEVSLNMAEIPENLDTSMDEAADHEEKQKAKISREEARQLLSNVTFLHCFLSDQISTTQDHEVQAYTKRISKLSDCEIESSTIESILRGVNETYKTSKHMYLPFSIN